LILTGSSSNWNLLFRLFRESKCCNQSCYCCRGCSYSCKYFLI